MKLCPECEHVLETSPVYDVLSVAGQEAANPEAKCPACGWTGPFTYGLTEPRIPNPKPAVPYLSIDIETTGLDPATCQILEIGVVYDNWTLPIRELPTWHCYVQHKHYVGEPYALWLNSAIFRTLANPPKDEVFFRPEQVAESLADWLKSLGEPQKAYTPAGKNFASFDRDFLKRLPDFEQLVRLHHRTLDPAMLWWQPRDEKLPDSKTCYERAGLDGKVAHTALEDALAVVWLLRAGFKRLRPF